MYRLKIEEFESVHQFCEVNSEKFVITDNLLYKASNGNWCIEDLLGFDIGLNFVIYFGYELWNCRPLEDGSTARIPITNLDYSVQDVFLYSGNILFPDSDSYAGTARINGERVLCTGSLSESSPSNIYEGDFFTDVINYKSSIIVRGQRGNSSLFCFDEHLNKLWENSLENYDEGLRGLRGKPQLYDNIVYLNMPKEVSYKSELAPMAIGAFSADTGVLLWEQILPLCVRNADLVDDKVYISSEAFLQIRDVRTGAIIWEMEPFWGENEIPCNLIPLSGNDLLVNFQFQPFALVVDYKTQAVKQTIRFPKGSPYCFSTLCLPKKLGENRWVWSTEFQNFTDNTRNSGLVFIEFDESFEDDVNCIEVKTRPPYKLTGKLNDSGEREYYLAMSHGDLDEIVRYCIIIIKNLAHDKGRCGLPNRPDNKHNGKVFVQINKDALQILAKDEAEVLQKLSLIKTITENSLNELGFKAGNKKDTFLIDVELV